MPSAPTAFVSPFSAPFSTAQNSPKFNPNHDELGRFTFGAAGPSDDTEDQPNDNAPAAAPATAPGDGSHFGPGIFGLPKKPTRATPTADTEDEEPSIEEELDPLADAKIAAFNSATDTLRELDPNNPLLNVLRNPDIVPTWQDTEQLRQAITDASRQNALNFFMPGGNPIGTEGNREDVRMVTGDLSTAQKDFDNLTIGGEPYNISGYSGIMIQLPGNGGFVGLRPSSSDNLPTIDVNINGVPFTRIHYR